jgi:pyruvate,water dikinase
MPVPEGFVVTADAQQVVTMDLPHSFEEEVSRTLEQYLDGSGELWTVCASPVAKTPEPARDTGRSDTELGVSPDEVAAAIRRLWKSVSKSSQAGAAVIVQRLLRPEAAGICSMVSPMRSNDRVFVYANYGFGESVVRGSVVPDTHVVDRQSLEPLMDILGSKTMQVVARDGGIAETGVPCDQQKQFCLSPRQVGSVAKLARAVEARQGKPMEIDWAYEEGTLYLLDARDPGP